MGAGSEEVGLLIDDSISPLEIIGLDFRLWHAKWDAVTVRVDFIVGYVLIQISYRLRRTKLSHLNSDALPLLLNFLLLSWL